MTIWSITLFFLSFAALGRSATAQTGGKPLSPNPTMPQVDALLDRLGGLPAEYKADLAFSVLEQKHIRFTAQRREAILNQIFVSAPSARYATLRLYAASNSDSVASQAAHSLANERLDALDIQVKVVTTSLAEMPQFAADTFARIVLPSAHSTCADPTVADVSSYYDAAAKLLDSPRVSVVAGQPKRQLLDDLVRTANEPERLAPLINLLARSSVTDTDLRGMIVSLTHTLEVTKASDREIVVIESPLAEAMQSLVSKLITMHLPSDQLLAAYRSFLVGSLATEACADKTADRSSAVKSFNALLDATVRSQLQPLDIAELKPVGKGPTVIDPSISFDDSLWPKIRKITQLKQQRMVASEKGLSTSDMEPNADDVRAILEYSLAPTTTADGCDLCAYEAHAFGFFLLVNNLPPGGDLQRTFDAEVDFLTFNRTEQSDPPAYVLILKELINIDRPLSDTSRDELQRVLNKVKGFSEIPTEESAALNIELHRSTDPILRAYVSYEDTFHPTYELPSVLKGGL